MQALSAANKKLPNAISRTIVIDAGCQGPYGHHIPVNRMLMDHCRRADIPLHILLNETCPDQIALSLGAEAILPPSTYLPLPANINAVFKLFEASNEQTFRQLLFQGPRLEDGDLVVLHTASFLHLLGVYKWRQIFHSKNVDFRIIFRFPPLGAFDISHIDGPTKSAALAFCRHVMALWSKRGGVQFFLDSMDFAAEYREQLGAVIQQICMPLQFDEANERINTSTKKDGGPLFLFPGAARKEKGIELLAEAIPRYLQERPNGRFIIQSIKGAPGKTAARLEELSSKIYPENVQILNQPLARADYLRLLSSADAVLLAYDPARYGSKESQIFYESIGMGRPIIVTKGTLMSDRLSKFEHRCGLTMDYTADDLITKLIDFEKRQTDLSVNAAYHAQEVRVTHNATRYLDSLFSFKSDRMFLNAIA